MGNSLDSYIDWVVTILLLVIALPFMFWTMHLTTSPKAGGFDSPLFEKTAQEAKGEVVPQTVHLSRKDIILSLFVVDNYMPMPRQFKFPDGQVITVDASFFADTEEQIRKVYNSVKDGKQYEYELEYGPQGPISWLIKEVK